jgi:hypothetical protein
MSQLWYHQWNSTWETGPLEPQATKAGDDAQTAYRNAGGDSAPCTR